ncbi:hypothetical protein B0H13DRAFT_2328637 [Mycena leptocephala]|nr:hypothetical protein B0H13DRAFT_2328637 [Mycena leptocephala]
MSATASAGSLPTLSTSTGWLAHLGTRPGVWEQTSFLDKAVRYLFDGDAAPEGSLEAIRMFGLQPSGFWPEDERRVAAASSSSHRLPRSAFGSLPRAGVAVAPRDERVAGRAEFVGSGVACTSDQFIAHVNSPLRVPVCISVRLRLRRHRVCSFTPMSIPQRFASSNGSPRALRCSPFAYDCSSTILSPACELRANHGSPAHFVLRQAGGGYDINQSSACPALPRAWSRRRRPSA